MSVLGAHQYGGAPGSAGEVWGLQPSSANAVYLPQRLFVVPASPEQKEIPFARVNHNKYMVTDRVAYIGTATRAAHADYRASQR